MSWLSFTTCFAIQKISFWWLGSFKLLANSFCFFAFAKEKTIFAFYLLFLYFFHASVDFSFFQFPYFSFFSLTTLATSSFHHHVYLWLHAPFDNPRDLCCFHHYTCIFHLLPVFIYVKIFPFCFHYLIFDHALVFFTCLFLLELPYTHSWFRLLTPSFCCIKPHVLWYTFFISNDLDITNLCHMHT